MKKLSRCAFGQSVMAALLGCAMAFFGCNSDSRLDEPGVHNFSEIKDIVKDALVLDGDWVCAQQGGYLVAQSRVGQDSILCGPVKAASTCTSTRACKPFESDIMTMPLALVVGQSFDLARDCSGNCGPISATLCATEGDGVVRPDGADYVGRWMCLAFVDTTTDACTMQAIQFPCGVNEACEQTGSYPYYGLCVEQYECSDDADCPDSGNQCAPYRCNGNGFCELVILDGDPCDDANACTESDVCKGSTCEGTVVDCDDENVCTNDSCDVIAGCQHAFNTDPCDDFSACTTVDICDGAGACHGTLIDCDDADVCTNDSCDPIYGCQYGFNTDPCDDADLCTEDDECFLGTCGGTPIDVDDANECTEDTCDPATGLPVNDPTPLDGAVCGLPANDDRCVQGLCVDLWCQAGDDMECMQISALLGLYECQLITPAFGEWVEIEHCGPIKGWACWLPQPACHLVGVVDESGLCADGHDNDGDGFVDCLDSDCLGDHACDICTPDCDTEVCGPDGCGGFCGTCQVGQTCNAAGQCVGCTPDCEGKECGSDGCGGSCGACDAGDTCDATGTCVALAADELSVTYILNSADVPAKDTFELMVFCTDAGGSTIISWGVKDTSANPGAGNLLLELVDEPATGLYDCHFNVRGRNVGDGPADYWWAAYCPDYPTTCLGLGNMSYAFGGHASVVGIKDNTNQPSDGVNFGFNLDDFDGDGVRNVDEPAGCEYNPDLGCGVL